MTAGYVGNAPVKAVFNGKRHVWSPAEQELSIHFENIPTGETFGQIIIIKPSNPHKTIAYVEYNATDKTSSVKMVVDGYEVLMDRWAADKYNYHFILKGPFYGEYTVTDNSGDVVGTAEFWDIEDYQNVTYDYGA